MLVKYTEITVHSATIKLTSAQNKITFRLLQKIWFGAMDQFPNCNELDLLLLSGGS